MNGLTRITEQMLTDDFDAIMARAEGGERFLIERPDGRNVVLVPAEDVYPQSFETKIEVDAEGNHFMRLPEAMLILMGWNVGDELIWLVEEPGRVLLRSRRESDVITDDNLRSLIDLPPEGC